MAQKALSVSSDAVIADTAASPNSAVLRDAQGGIAVNALAATALQTSGTYAGTVVAKSAAFTAAAATDYIVDCTSAAVTATLPLAASNVGVVYTFTKKDASGNAVTISAGGGTLYGTSTISSQFGRLRVISDGTAWYSA